ncbi:hypothetical protein Anas_12384 [Armadillidium nasatum]|uniref:Uncharacterized protein n=1 Tax=Armadillidium nasatum TaxID=96803 RepID=A0A5N5TAK2_9CRUS|nr:hypothetical protein Anas_12384 [Armadillidium nasatum]
MDKAKELFNSTKIYIIYRNENQRFARGQEVKRSRDQQVKRLKIVARLSEIFCENQKISRGQEVKRKEVHRREKKSVKLNIAEEKENAKKNRKYFFNF